jgi:hypothetical protein
MKAIVDIVGMCCWLALAGCGDRSTGVASGVPFTRSDTRSLSGSVTDVAVAGPYSYVTFRQSDGSVRTAATLGAPAQIGDIIDVTAFAVRESFHSTRLSRTFAPLDFGVVHVR